MADHRVVALLGRGVVPADTPVLRADDLGVLRGDGCFETMHVRDGRAWLLDEHLARMARSAGRLEIALPPAPALASLAAEALAVWPAGLEGVLRLVCTRGGEDGGPVTCYATIGEVRGAVRRARRDGLTVVTASLGLPADLRQTAPWLLGGAKTLSYAVNMASQRWATSVGADDVLWVSTDGYALEGPTSSLVWRTGSVLHTVPVEPTGILPGTTARWLLDRAESLGLTAADSMVRPADLTTVDGAWFVSSVRGVAAIRTLDGAPVPTRPPETARLQEFLGYPV